ncbi:MAG TPA: imidazole glycerol phosphate synthase subunit HisH [Myxococcales bacterium LLY-WYZ-16_1]|nr:imidazole glycerol phosphate synthase subunit HisH [Myxococcales bacterium LLY-WYZ-16_1]
MKVGLIPTGIANVASVTRGLERLGATVERVEDGEAAARVDRLVLPGVGAFSAAMEVLRARGFDRAIRAHVEAKKPLLAVCLGFQLLGASSEEAAGTAGLGIHDGAFVRFGPDVRCPHLGWNSIEPEPGCRHLRSGHVFFAHSFRLREPPAGWRVATADHQGPFVAAVERGPILATQFHPELSGVIGKNLLERWLQGASSC